VAGCPTEDITVNGSTHTKHAKVVVMVHLPVLHPKMGQGAARLITRLRKYKSKQKNARSA
jgi:hypothetical protein